MISNKRARAISSSIFLLGLAFLIYTVNWWPGILAVIGLSVGLRLYLYGRYLEMLFSLVCFIGVFGVIQFEITGKWVLPFILTTWMAYILWKYFGRAYTKAKA